MDDDEISAQLREHIRAAFSMDARPAQPPGRLERAWRKVSPKWRRARRIARSFASYDRAHAEFQAEQAAYAAALPGRMNDVAAQVSELLPEGLRFEWKDGD